METTRPSKWIVLNCPQRDICLDRYIFIQGQIQDFLSENHSFDSDQEKFMLQQANKSDFVELSPVGFIRLFKFSISP